MEILPTITHPISNGVYRKKTFNMLCVLGLGTIKQIFADGTFQEFLSLAEVQRAKAQISGEVFKLMPLAICE
jgi:hypothetical protein